MMIAATAAVILKYSRVGALHGDTFRLYALVGEARGVLTGSEVWLSGQKIGKITRIQFRAPTTDSTARLEIEMEVLERHRRAMHRDALAQIQSGGSIIGAPVVYLSPGTTKSAPLRAGDTVHTRPQSDLEEATSQVGYASREFPAIIGNVKLLAAQLQTTQGTIGALVNGPGMGELGRAQIDASQLMARLAGGSGTIGQVIQRRLSERAGRVMARADSLRTLLASPTGAYGRFRRDSTLLQDAAHIREELSLVLSELDEPRGTAGRLLRDSALVSSLHEAQREMTLLVADLKKHPFRYVAF